MSKKETLLSRDEYKNNIYNLQKELDEIFYALMDNKKMKAFEANTLACQLENFMLKVNDNLDNYLKIGELATAKYQKRLKIIMSILIANTALLFTFFPLAIAIALICFYKIYNYKIEQINDAEDNDINFANHLTKMNIEVGNCLNLIEYIKNTRKERAAEPTENVKVRMFDLANDVIHIYLTEGIKEWETLPFCLQNLVISILQDDLKTDETEIYNLIELANQKLDGLYDPKFLDSEDTLYAPFSRAKTK